MCRAASFRAKGFRSFPNLFRKFSARAASWRDRSRTLDTSLDDLLPVPSPSETMSEPSESEASKGYGESLLTGYAADQSLADAIAEADIYVAYGRHQHALDTLEAASAAEPKNASGLLKMVDIYISLDRIEEAQRLMATIERTGDRDAISMAVAKLSGVSNTLEGDAAARALAAESELVDSDEVESGAVESKAPDEIDVSLDLEFPSLIRLSVLIRAC